jgi:cbb3-type cytochrome oxidase subunit 3
MQFATLLAHAAVLTDTKVPIIMPSWAFGAIAFGIFLFFGVVVWTYRDVANRHAHKAAASYHDDNQHGSAGHH